MGRFYLDKCLSESHKKLLNADMSVLWAIVFENITDFKETDLFICIDKYT